MKFLQKSWLSVSCGILCLNSTFSAFSQFAPPAGQLGSTAIHADSSAIVAWATSCNLTLGPQDISATVPVYPITGADSSGVGKANGIYVVSLGDGGSATLSFEFAIRNGEGPDFAVYENSFDGTFLELAFVEVSSDGVNFVRFPAISNTPTAAQVSSFGTLDATKIHNLAGKYKGTYGVPFDLEELKDSASIDVSRITHVRVVDVVGSINPLYASYDSQGNMINDPWPTDFSSGGFDLDGVAVLHNTNPNSGIKVASMSEGLFFPNPADEVLFVAPTSSGGWFNVLVLNSMGMVIARYENVTHIEVADFPAGLYYFVIDGTEHQSTQKIIIAHE